MTIVITDGITLNPGDLDWTPLQKFGTVRNFDTTPAHKVQEHCEGSEVIITNKTIIPADLIRKSSTLKLIAVSATGYNNVDVAAAKEKGVVVCNVPEYGTYSVAQHTFALLLQLMNHTCENIMSTKNDEWAGELWSYTRIPITELQGKQMGIVGFGRIGRQVAIIAQAFGMNVVFNNRSEVKNSGFKQVSLEELFSQSDVVSLHCPLTSDNKEFVNLRFLRMMKKSAVLVNTSRGALINENDLLTALNEGTISGAALDVLTTEPPAANHPLVHHKNCMVTPHNAWISVEARTRLMETTIQNVESFVAGKPQNVVS